MYLQCIPKRFTWLSALCSVVLLSTAQADLSQEILNGIKSGNRSIRAEVTSLKQVPVPEPSKTPPWPLWPWDHH